MKFKMNLFLQVLGTVMQGLMAVSPMMTGKSKIAAEITVAAAKGVVAAVAHYSNPDGTKAEEPYFKN